MFLRLFKRAARPGGPIHRWRSNVHLTKGHARRLLPTVRNCHTGRDPCAASRHELVYVHYDPAGRVHDFTLVVLAELVRLGHRITFVSNAPRFTASQVARVAPFCRQMLHRWNTGYDFGAYKDGILAVGPLGALDGLVVLNDSVYGPLYPLDEFFAKAQASPADLFGVTDSWEYGYHVQSYCMVFKPTLLRAAFFEKFWRRAPYVSDKWSVVFLHEVGFTRLVVREGLRVAVLCPFREIARRALAAGENEADGRNTEPPLRPRRETAYFGEIRDLLATGGKLNASHCFWRTLIEDFRCPFLKRDLIAHNPMKVPDIWQWHDVLETRTAYDVSLIERHLQTL